MPVVGVIAPEAHAAVQATRNRRIGLLATAGTVASGRYEPLVRTLDAGVRMTVGRLPAARAADRVRRPVRAARRSRRCATTPAPLKAPARHGHPRLHALPADPADLPARLRPRRHARLLGRGDRPRGRRDARTQGDRERRRRARATTASSRPATPRPSASMGARFLQLPIGEVEHVTIAELERAAA